MNQEQLRRLSQMFDIFDKSLAEGTIEVPPHVAIQAMKHEKDLVEGVHGKSNDAYEAIIMAIKKG